MDDYIYHGLHSYRCSMIRNNAYSTKLVLVAFVLLLLFSGSGLFAQVFNDGPINVRARLREFSPSFPQTDAAVFGVVGQPDDLSYNIWGREPVGNGVSWTGGGPGNTCSGNGLLEDYDLPFTDWNQVFYNFTYPTPANGSPLEIRLDA